MSVVQTTPQNMSGTGGSPPKPLVLSISPLPQVEIQSTWYQAWQRFCRNPLALVGAIVVLLWFWTAIGASALAPYRFDSFDFNAINQDPSVEHFLGTDSLGRDVFTLIMYGSRVSVAVATVVPLMSVAIGLAVGLTAGYFGGKLDTFLMRVTDAMFAFPSLLLMILLIAAFGRNLWTIFVSLGIASWPSLARLIRSEVMQIKQADYILSARSIGTPVFQIIFTHVLPNMIGPVLVTATLTIPDAIAAEAFLTFIGIGAEPSIPSWGMLINDARDTIFWHPTLILFPAVAVSSLTLAFSFLGDGLRDALDPRMID